MVESHVEIAKQLKHNSEEIRNYFEDLYNWQGELKEKEKYLRKNEKVLVENKKRENIIETEDKIQENHEINNTSKNRACILNKKSHSFLRRDGNSIDSYYKAWDQLDVNEIETYENETYYNKIKEEKRENQHEECKIIESLEEKSVDYEVNEICEWEPVSKKSLVPQSDRLFDIYMSKMEEIKFNCKKKNFNKCIECCNDIINYIDFELKNNNLFSEIEKNYENELCIEILSNTYNFDKATEELFILRIKILLKRSSIYQKTFNYFESIQDCSCIILFLEYFLSDHLETTNYPLKKFPSTNIKHILFSSYYLRGVAKYKLKIYKSSLRDIEKAKELSDQLGTSSTLNINKSLVIVENLVKENKIRRHIHRQHEYTSTLLEQFTLEPRKLDITFIPRECTKQLKEEDSIPMIKEKLEGKEEVKSIENLKKIQNVTHGNENYNNTKKNDLENESSDSVDINSILSDTENTRPLLIISNKCSSTPIKNKINFELLWNSNNIKKSVKKQIELLKGAFLEEGIFEFSLDKDLYVDILDALFKNHFLELFETHNDEKRIKESFFSSKSVDVIHSTMNVLEYPGNLEKEKELLNEIDYLIIIDLFYCMTNWGKEKYIFLFIDKEERQVVSQFFNFVISNSNQLHCNQNSVLIKIESLKQLL